MPVVDLKKQWDRLPGVEVEGKKGRQHSQLTSNGLLQSIFRFNCDKLAVLPNLLFMLFMAVGGFALVKDVQVTARAAR